MNKVFSILTIFIFAIACLLVQGSILSNFIKIVPNLLLIIVIFLSFNSQLFLITFLSFCLGLLYDLSSANFIGPAAGGFLIVNLIIKNISDKLFINSFVSQIFTSFILSVIYLFSELAFKFWYMSEGSFSLSNILIESIYTGIASPFIFFIFNKFNFLYLRSDAKNR